jgi:hypothetical protein
LDQGFRAGSRCGDRRDIAAYLIGNVHVIDITVFTLEQARIFFAGEPPRSS